MAKTAKEFFASLIGMDITEAEKELGDWWVLSHCGLNIEAGLYIYERPAGGRVELRTGKLNGKLNVVVSEHHNMLAEFYQKRDLKQYE